MIPPSTPGRRVLLPFAAAVFALYAAIGFGWTFALPVSGDEGHFVETVRRFAHAPTLTLLRNYEEMSGPLPFAAYAAWGRIFGTDLLSLRIANLLVGVAAQTALLDLFLAVLGPGRRTWFAAACFLFQPYLVYLSLFVHTDAMAMLALVLGYRALLAGRMVPGAIALAAALLCRQYCVFAVAGVLAFAAQRRDRPGLRSAAAALAACVPLGALMAFWGGLNPANEIRHRYESEALKFHWESLVLYLSLIPIYLAPFAWLWRGFRRRDALVAACFAALYWLAPVGASPSSYSATVDTVGAFHRAMRAAGIPFTGQQGVFCAGFAVAGALLSRTLRQWRRVPEAQWFHWQTAAFLAIMPLSYLHWEKYLLPVLPAIVLAMLLEPAIVAPERRPDSAPEPSRPDLLRPQS